MSYGIFSLISVRFCLNICLYFYLFVNFLISQALRSYGKFVHVFLCLFPFRVNLFVVRLHLYYKMYINFVNQFLVSLFFFCPVLYSTVCPRSLDPFYMVTCIGKMGQEFMDIQYGRIVAKFCIPLLLLF